MPTSSSAPSVNSFTCSCSDTTIRIVVAMRYRMSAVPRSGCFMMSSIGSPISASAEHEVAPRPQRQIHRIAGEQLRQRHDDRDLRQLRRLDAERAEAEPARRALDRLAADEHRDQQHDADAVDGVGQPLEQPIVARRGDDEQHATDGEPHQLVLVEPLRRHARRRVEVDQADGDDGEDGAEQRPVELACAACGRR